MGRATLYHIPICPFSQRLEILLELSGLEGVLDFEVVDITVPRPDWLLAKSRGTTALPILELEGGRVIKESLVILRYILEAHDVGRLWREDPWERAIENMLMALCEPWLTAGYVFVLNQDPERRSALETKLLDHYAKIDDFLRVHGGEGPWLFDDFGLAEVVFTPFFQRFWFLEYYEGFALPEDGRFERIREWEAACVAHPRAQQTSREEIVKLYYDYAQGLPNGALGEGRTRSSFTFEPSWEARPWPPRTKYGAGASDSELGLVGPG